MADPLVDGIGLYLAPDGPKGIGIGLFLAPDGPKVAGVQFPLVSGGPRVAGIAFFMTAQGVILPQFPTTERGKKRKTPGEIESEHFAPRSRSKSREGLPA